MTPPLQKNWSLMEPDKAAAFISSKLDTADARGGWRWLMAQRGARAYSSVIGGDLFGHFSEPVDRRRTNNPGRYQPHIWNHARSIVQTAVAKVAGLDNTKPQMVTSDAGWEERVDAIWADRFIEGNYHQRQGSFADVWALGRHGMTMCACSTGLAGIRVEPNFIEKRVTHTLRSTLNTFWDRGDIGLDCQPRSCFDVTWENPEILCEDPRWSEHKDYIMSSADELPNYMRPSGELDFGTRVVKVITAWRTPFGSFKGREARFVGGKAIQWDDYEHDQPRIALLRLLPRVGDTLYGENVIEGVLDALAISDRVVRRTEQTLDRLSDFMGTYDPLATPKSALGTAKNTAWVPVSSKHPGAREPKVLHVPIVDSSRMDFARENVEQAHAVLGISQMHTASQHAPGVQSGRAIRMDASLLAERLVEWQRAWRSWIAVDTAKLNVEAAREIGQHDKDWQVTWPGQDFGDVRIKVQALERMNGRIYTIRPYPVNEVKNTPADRAEFAKELLDQGVITEEAHAYIVGGTFDTPGETKRLTSSKRFFSKLIETALYATREDIEDPEFWATKYQEPPPFTEPGAALAQIYSAYFDAMVDDVPQYRRDILRNTADILANKLKLNTMQEATAQGLRAVVEAPTVADAFGGATSDATQPNSAGLAAVGGAAPAGA